jgi:hypothetical protein
MVVAPADIEIEADENCEWDANTEITGMATASDNCSGEAGVSLNYSDVEEDMGKGVIIITRTWTAVDACGNSATDQQVITVTGGNAPPVLELNEISIYLTESGQWTLNQFDIAALTAGSVLDVVLRMTLTLWSTHVTSIVPMYLHRSKSP